MTDDLLSAVEQELGFTLHPAYRYGSFSELKSVDISTPERLFVFVNDFYTATLLYYRTFSIVHYHLGFNPTGYSERLGMGSADISGYEQLVDVETRFPDIVKTIDPPMNTDFIEEWIKRQHKSCKTLSKLGVENTLLAFIVTQKKVQPKVQYSVKLSEFFRDELIARMEFYKRLREELAQALHKDVRDFSQLHALFVQYYGSMRFFDLYHFGRGLSEGHVGLLLMDERYDYYLNGIATKCALAEKRANKEEYQQEYFFAVREHYKEVIQCALRMVNSEQQYSTEQKKHLLQYITFDYLSDLCSMEHIWYPYCVGSIGTWKYSDFYYDTLGGYSEWTDTYANVNKNDLEDLKRVLLKIEVFITENPRFGRKNPLFTLPIKLVDELFGN